MSEWIEVDEKWITFSGKVKIGMIIEVENGDQYLVGHINILGGTCDCCSEFIHSDVIKRYKIIDY